jgi:2-polyprenyl-3-methyl-5-hydroxy-6-metoxy-1,4-benzoquinol methylase
MHSQYSKKTAMYYGNARSDIAPFLPSISDKILEIGCGDGATLNWLKSSNKCRYTVGMEYFPSAAEKAQECCDEIYSGPVENHIGGLSDESFDMVLCLDVLEHLQDPWVILNEIYRVLRPGGILICSLPNVRHISVILPLIFKNQWAYQPSGIMDSTHLRFFTTRSALDALSDAAFHVEKVQRKMPALISKSGIVNFVCFGLLKDFVAPQFLIKAAKKL